MTEGIYNISFQYSQDNITSSDNPTSVISKRLQPQRKLPKTEVTSCCHRFFEKLNQIIFVINRELNWFCSHTSLRALPRVSKAVSPQARIFWTTIFIILLSSAVVCLYFLISSFLQFKTSFETQEEKKFSPFPSITICPHRPLSKYGEKLVNDHTPKWFADQYSRWAQRYMKSHHEENKGVDASRNPLPLGYPGYSQYFQRFKVNEIPIYTPKQKNLLFECRVNTGSSMGLTSIATWVDCIQNKAKIERIVNSQHFLCYTITLQDLILNTANGISITLFLENYINVTVGDSPSSLLHCQQCMSLLPETWRQGARVVIHQPKTSPDIAKGIDLSPGSINEITFDTVFTSYMTPPYGDCTNDIIKRDIEANNITYNYTIEACEQQQLQNFIRNKCGCIDATLPMKKTDYDNPIYCENWPWEEMNANITIENKVINSSRCLLNAKLAYDQRKYNHYCEKPCQRITNTIKTSSTIGFRRSMLHYLYMRLQNSSRINGPISSIEKFETLAAEKNSTLDAATALMLARDFHDSFIVVDIKRLDFSPQVIKEREDFKLYNLLSMIGGVCSLFLGFSIFVFFELGEVVYYIIRGVFLKDSRPRAAEERRKTKREHNRQRQQQAAKQYTETSLPATEESVVTGGIASGAATVGPSTPDVLAKYNPYPLKLTMFNLERSSVSSRIPRTRSLDNFASIEAIGSL